MWRFLRNRRLLLCLHTIFRALIYWAHRAVILAIAWHLVIFPELFSLCLTDFTQDWSKLHCIISAPQIQLCCRCAPFKFLCYYIYPIALLRRRTTELLHSIRETLCLERGWTASSSCWRQAFSAEAAGWRLVSQLVRVVDPTAQSAARW